MAKVKIGFSGLSVPEQIERARSIVTKMTGNASYTTPSPALAVVTAAVNALETAYNLSRNRDTEKVAAMVLRRKEMLFQINQEGAYVQEASEGDAEKILSSGFSIVGTKTVHPDIAGEVHNVQLNDGSNSGKVRVDFDKASDAVIYVIEASKFADFSGDEELLKGVTTKTHKEISGLTVGTKYWVRVFGLGKEEVGPYSEPVSIIVR